MPSILEVFTAPITLVVCGAYACLMLWEAWRPARPLPARPLWRLQGLACFCAFTLLATYLPLWWDPHLAPFRLLDASAWPLPAQVATGVLGYQLCAYFWHRALHRVPALWRWLHQMHHSAERLDTSSAYFFGPLDMVGWSFVMSVALVVVVGLSGEAAGPAALISTLLALIGHVNVRTPRWLGYFVQRPENHRLHHTRGVHRHNYADLPLVDALFGTFRNPEKAESPTGFYDGASARTFDMLLGRDVSTPKRRGLESTPGAERVA